MAVNPSVLPFIKLQSCQPLMILFFKVYKKCFVQKNIYHGPTHEISPGSTQENPFKNDHGLTHEILHGSTHETFQMIRVQPL